MSSQQDATIGFMQGRLSPPLDGRIQAFPWHHWRSEFEQAGSCGFELMEWTLDHERLYENPIMTPGGRREIRELEDTWSVRVESVTGDCFMQSPFWKAEADDDRQRRLDDLAAVAAACGELGVKYLVVPLVDNGRLESERQRDALLDGFGAIADELRRAGVMVAFESDFGPSDLWALMASFDAEGYGINYDTGNSAALGYDPAEEIRAYGGRIVNVHIKDRHLGGGTVPLGEGAADLPKAVRLLVESGYSGRYVLQTARAADGDHTGAACRYREMLQCWLEAAHGGGD